MSIPARTPVEHPLLPGEANTVLTVVAFLYGSSGALYLLGLWIMIGGKVAGWQLVADVVVHPLTVGIGLLVASGYLATAWLLARRRRLGGALGIGFAILSLATQPLSGDPVGVFDILLPVGLLLALAFAWTHLSSADPSHRDA